MLTHQSLVRAFHEKFSIPVRDKPGVPSDERVRLRLRLIAEEFCELLTASLDVSQGRHDLAKVTLDFTSLLTTIISNAKVNVDLVEFVDALADLEYVIHGTSCEFGVDSGPVFAEVHRSNCTKHAQTDAQCKITKGPNYEPPDIAGCLRAQGWDEFDAMAQSVGELPTSMLAGSPKPEREPTILDASGHRVIGPETCDHGVKFDAEAARELSAAQVRQRWPRLYGACPLGCGYHGIAYASWEHYGAGDW